MTVFAFVLCYCLTVTACGPRCSKGCRLALPFIAVGVGVAACVLPVAVFFAGADARAISQCLALLTPLGLWRHDIRFGYTDSWLLLFVWLIAGLAASFPWLIHRSSASLPTRRICRVRKTHHVIRFQLRTSYTSYTSHTSYGSYRTCGTNGTGQQLTTDH